MTALAKRERERELEKIRGKKRAAGGGPTKRHRAGRWGQSRRELMRILDKGLRPTRQQAQALAARLGPEVTVHDAGGFGYELRLRPPGKGEQILYSLGPNEVIWRFWQGRREHPVVLLPEAMRAKVRRDADGYPELVVPSPWADPWVMAARIDPDNEAIPADARRYARQHTGATK